MASGVIAERVWSEPGALAGFARAILTPVELAYAGAVAVRGALYDTGMLRAHTTAVPVLAVGNLSVGGTGKTPVSAWLAAQLAERGASPAVVLRGFGGDEPLVHAALNPTVPVVTGADRVEAVARAARLGSDVAVLDDAFQHRRIWRVADVVLVSAERWTGERRLLPAGPWREPATALRRAHLVAVTRKTASPGRAEQVADQLRRFAPTVPHAVIHLALGELRDATGTAAAPLARLTGARVLAISAIGDARAFVRQLELAGAHVSAATFGDHHQFTARELSRLVAAAEACEHTVCTLKDAVKLAPLWPRQAPRLWYVSQHVGVQHGSEAVHALLAAVLRARRPQP